MVSLKKYQLSLSVIKIQILVLMANINKWKENAVPNVCQHPVVDVENHVSEMVWLVFVKLMELHVHKILFLQLVVTNHMKILKKQKSWNSFVGTSVHFNLFVLQGKFSPLHCYFVYFILFLLCVCNYAMSKMWWWRLYLSWNLYLC